MTTNSISDLSYENIVGRSRDLTKEVGFSNRYLEIIPTSWAPTKDIYFRFKK